MVFPGCFSQLKEDLRDDRTVLDQPTENKATRPSSGHTLAEIHCRFAPEADRRRAQTVCLQYTYKWNVIPASSKFHSSLGKLPPGHAEFHKIQDEMLRVIVKAAQEVAGLNRSWMHQNSFVGIDNSWESVTGASD
jgi:hypothetical protein